MKSRRFIAWLLPFVVASFVFLTPRLLMGQTHYVLSPVKEGLIRILGTSSMHDWTMSSSAMDSQGEFSFNSENELLGVSAFSFRVEAKSLKSGHDSMDTRTYKAMKAGQFPTVLYTLRTAIIKPIKKDSYLMSATGDLTIAGTIQSITVEVTMVVQPDRTIRCTGSEKLKLTDYNIEVPAFMLGTMKVGDDLTIQMDFLYKKQSVL